MKYFMLCLALGGSIILLALKLISSGTGRATIPTPRNRPALENSDLQVQTSIPQSQIQAGNLNSLASAYALKGEYQKAIEYFQQSLAAAQASQSLWGEGMATQVLNNLGTTLFLAGDLDRSEQILLEVVERAESQRARIGDNEAHNVQFFDTQQSYLYRTLQQVLIAQGKPETALEIAERGRAKVFIEQLAKRLPIASEQTQFLAPVEATSASDIRRIAKTQNATLVIYSLVPETAKLFAGRDQDELRNTPTKLLIWVVQPSGNISFREQDLHQVLDKSTSLGELVKLTRANIRAQKPINVDFDSRKNKQSVLTQQLRQLHQILVEPIAEFLPQTPTEQVIFAPQESLLLVPFAALQDQAGRYLIQDHTILTTPSIQVLNWTQQQHQTVQQAGLQEALILGNPAMPTLPAATQPLQALPGAAQEAREVAQFFCEEGLTDSKGACPKAITGRQGTKAAVLAQMPRSRIIHLATHGVLDIVSEMGVPGAIALAPAGADDGWLKADEILNLDLNAELVVLSACDTGRGSIRADGVLGLSRAFMIAGAPSVLVSLWSIPDAPTTILMTEFYRQFQKKGLSKAVALRQAQIAMITGTLSHHSTKTRSSVDWNPGKSTSAPITSNHSHPSTWAPFILIGNGL